MLEFFYGFIFFFQKLPQPTVKFKLINYCIVDIFVQYFSPSKVLNSAQWNPARTQHITLD